MFPSGGFVSGFNPNSGSNAFIDEIGNDQGLETLSDSGQITEVKSSIPGQPKDSLSYLWELAQKDPAYIEVYLQNLAERENTTQAQKWYENMSSTAIQRQMMDLKKAGLNPWLAVQNLSGAGSGSVSPAGTSSLSPYQQKVQKDLGEKQNALKAVQIAGSIATSVLLMTLMLM